MESNKRRIKYLGTTFQKKIMFLVFTSSAVSATLVLMVTYSLIFTLLAWQMNYPTAIVNNLIPVLKKVNLIISLSLPLTMLIIWLVSLEISHRMAGPLYRIEKEIDDRLNGIKKGPIKLRKNDDFKLFADKFNKLMG